MNEEEIRKLIQDKIDHLFNFYPLMEASIKQSISKDHEWDLEIKLRMGRPYKFHEGLRAMLDVQNLDWYIDENGEVRTISKPMRG